MSSHIGGPPGEVYRLGEGSDQGVTDRGGFRTEPATCLGSVFGEDARTHLTRLTHPGAALFDLVDLNHVVNHSIRSSQIPMNLFGPWVFREGYEQIRAARLECPNETGLSFLLEFDRDRYTE